MGVTAGIILAYIYADIYGVHAYHDMWPNIGIVIFISDNALTIHVLLKCQEFERTIWQKRSLIHKWTQIFI
jgi:hypothetical protein